MLKNVAVNMAGGTAAIAEMTQGRKVSTQSVTPSLTFINNFLYDL
jgi:hypothetical protein